MLNQKKTFIDQSSRIERIKQETINFDKKNHKPSIENGRNVIRKALTSTRSGGYVVPPKVWSW